MKLVILIKVLLFNLDYFELGPKTIFVIILNSIKIVKFENKNLTCKF